MKTKVFTSPHFQIGRLGLVLVLSCLFAACSTIDCPLNNRVYTNYSVLAADGTPYTQTVPTTISTNRTDGSDSVLINKDVNFSSFSLPISNTQPRDTFFVEQAADTWSAVDTIVVEKENSMHFESTDCAASYFHYITGVTTTHHAIDAVEINNHEVNYDTTKKHFYIYFTPRD